MKVILLLCSISLCMSLNLWAQTPDESAELLATLKVYSNNHDLTQEINPEELKGQWQGQCVSDSKNPLLRSETLYWENFENAAGEFAYLPISTEQFYGGDSLPESLSVLNTSAPENWSTVTHFVKEGLSGTDNNLGALQTGKNFKYLYQASGTPSDYTLTVSPSYTTCPDRTVCNPPTMEICRHKQSRNSNGTNTYQFSGCIRNNDKTVFKKIHNNYLVSHRTAEGMKGTPANQFSFWIYPVSSYCLWTKAE